MATYKKQLNDLLFKAEFLKINIPNHLVYAKEDEKIKTT